MESKRAAWEALRAAAASSLGPGMVFGEGHLDAHLAFVGEAPGQQEVARQRPFVGPAGQLFDRLLTSAGIDRGSVYVTNTVKLRPTIEDQGRIKNRAPRVGEIRTGLEVLLPELQLVAPRYLVLLGNIPAKALIGRDFAMGKGRGTWHETIAGIPALPTYHPAYILRLEGDDFDRTYALVIADLRLAASREA